MKHVKDIMSSPVVTVEASATVKEAAKVMTEKNIGSLAVMEDNKLAGILTERDISRRIVAENQNPAKVKVSSIMHQSPVTAKPHMTIFEASTTMMAGGFRRLPVMEGKKLVGIVTETDLELALREEALDESRARIREREKFSQMVREQEFKIAKMKEILSELERAIKGK